MSLERIPGEWSGRLFVSVTCQFAGVALRSDSLQLNSIELLTGLETFVTTYVSKKHFQRCCLIFNPDLLPCLFC